MKSCSLHHWILFFIILIPVADLTFTSLTAKFHQPVTLTCNQKCSGPVKWKMINGYVVARCNQTSCSSEEGFEISHDQYLKGNLTLIIRSFDFSKRTIYTCYCGDKDVCNISLIIEPRVSAIQKKRGEDLVLDLHIPQVEVFYKSKRTANPYSEWTYNVADGSVQCGTDYKQRASLNHTELTLRELKVSDSGVYTVRDMNNKEIILKYIVSVKGIQRPVSFWMFVGLVILLLIFLVMIFTLNMVRKKITQHKMQRHLPKIRDQMARVDKLIERYRNRGNGSKPADTTVGDPLKMEGETDLFKRKGNRKESEINNLKEWQSRKKAELDKIIKAHKREREELELLRIMIKNVGAGKKQSLMRPDTHPSDTGGEEEQTEDL